MVPFRHSPDGRFAAALLRFARRTPDRLTLTPRPGHGVDAEFARLLASVRPSGSTPIQSRVRGLNASTVEPRPSPRRARSARPDRLYGQPRVRPGTPDGFGAVPVPTPRPPRRAPTKAGLSPLTLPGIWASAVGADGRTVSSRWPAPGSSSPEDGRGRGSGPAFESTVRGAGGGPDGSRRSRHRERQRVALQVRPPGNWTPRRRSPSNSFKIFGERQLTIPVPHLTSPLATPMPRTPILFFPGIMGSRLYFPNSRRYWDPDPPDGCCGGPLCGRSAPTTTTASNCISRNRPGSSPRRSGRGRRAWNGAGAGRSGHSTAVRAALAAWRRRARRSRSGRLAAVSADTWGVRGEKIRAGTGPDGGPESDLDRPQYGRIGHSGGVESGPGPERAIDRGRVRLPAGDGAVVCIVGFSPGWCGDLDGGEG